MLWRISLSIEIITSRWQNSSMIVKINLRRAREDKHLEQKDVAQKVGVSRQTIGAIEAGRIKRPDKDVLHKLANIYDLDENALYIQFGYTPASYSQVNKGNLQMEALNVLEQAIKAYIPVYAEVSAGGGMEG